MAKRLSKPNEPPFEIERKSEPVDTGSELSQTNGAQDEAFGFLVSNRRLAVSIKRVYGGTEVLYAVEQVRMPGSELEQQMMLHGLTNEMLNMHRYFVDKILPNVPKSIVNQSSKPSLDPAPIQSLQESPVSIAGKDNPAVKLYKLAGIWKTTNQYGKTVYKALTTSGRYSKFGVTIFPDKMKEYGFMDEFKSDPKLLSIPVHGKTIGIEHTGQYANVVLIRETREDDEFTQESENPDRPF